MGRRQAVRRHPWATHGGFSVMARVGRGTLDGRFREAVAIRTICLRLAADLGADWEALSTQQRLLCEQVATKAVVLSLMAAFALGPDEKGTPRPMIGKDGTLAPPLATSYLAWANSLRFDLQTLGLERREKQVVDLVAALASARGRSDVPGPPDGTVPGAAGEVVGP